MAVALRDKIRILLVDDQLMTRRALKSVLMYEPRIDVTGEASDGNEAARMVGEIQPDLVLMDVTMPVMNGLKATGIIKSAWPATKVVVYTIDPTFRDQALQAGADYFLVKGSLGKTPAQIILSFFPIEGAAEKV